MAQRDTETEFPIWLSSLQISTPTSSTDSSMEERLSFSYGDTSESCREQILDVLSPPPTDTSQSASSDISSAQVWRSLSLQPPQDSQEDPVLVPAQLNGARQGLSMSPLEFMATLLAGEPLPSQAAGTVDQEAAARSNPLHAQESSGESHSMEVDEGADQSTAYSSQGSTLSIYSDSLNGEAVGTNMDWDGDTSVSTTSTVSQIRVVCIEGLHRLQLEGHRLPIPLRELDDPPDRPIVVAASLDTASEIEQSSLD